MTDKLKRPGLVEVDYLVSREGRVSEVQLQALDGPPELFTEVQQRWLLRCAFRPARLGDLPVPMRRTRRFGRARSPRSTSTSAGR